MKSNVIEMFKHKSTEQNPLGKSGWSESFQKSATELSGFIRGLPLDKEANDQLVALMVQNVELSFRDGFNLGYEFRGSELAIEAALKKGDKDHE